MTSIFSIIKNLGATVGDGVNVCTTTVSGTNGGNVGISFFVSQSSSKTQRMYRVNVGKNSASDWKRLAPTSSVGKFSGNNVWAVDILSTNNVYTLRLVRTSSSNPPETSTLSIKLFAYATTGETVLVEDSTTTYTDIDTDAIPVYERALVGFKEGNVGVNNDDPSHTLDVTGNINVKNTYKIRSNVILSETTLGPSVIYSNLQQVGNLSSLHVDGDINFTGNLLLSGNVYGQVSDPSFVMYGSTTAFTYTGAGVSLNNPLPFSSLKQSRGVEFSDFTENNTVLKFLMSGSYAVQVEVESGYPWFPDGDITTYFLVNGTEKLGVQHHDGGSSFTCTRVLNIDVDVNDTLSFFIESIVGNVYEATVQKCRLRVSKIETGFGGFNPKFTGLTQGTTGNLLYINPSTGNVTYDVLKDVEIRGNLSVNSTTLKVDASNNTVQLGSSSSSSTTGNNTTLQVYGNVSTNVIHTTDIHVTGTAATTDMNVSGNLVVNGSLWASSVVYSTTTPFTYTGPGVTYSNGVSFYAQTSTNGTPFVTADGTNNSIFTFTTSGTYMLQAEIENGYPWFPEVDIKTYYVKNGDPTTKFGSETYSPTNFTCTRPYLMTVGAGDNVRFIIDSSSGNEYEAGIDSSRLTMLKF